MPYQLHTWPPPNALLELILELEAVLEGALELKGALELEGTLELATGLHRLPLNDGNSAAPPFLST